MAFPPKKKSDSASKTKKPSGPPKPEAAEAGLPPGLSGGPPPVGPPGPPDVGGLGVPPDLGGMGSMGPPIAGLGPPSPPNPLDMAQQSLSGMGVPPGQGMDNNRAMHFGLSDPFSAGPPKSPQGTPMEPGGLPVGGSLPPSEPSGTNDPTMGGSSLLQALTQSLGGGAGGMPQSGDPYSLPPGGPDNALTGIGTGSPQGGLEQILNLLALAQMGVQGAVPGKSGIDQSSYGQMGLGLGI